MLCDREGSEAWCGMCMSTQDQSMVQASSCGSTRVYMYERRVYPSMDKPSFGAAEWLGFRGLPPLDKQSACSNVV
jgi:hypothetical protein